MISTIVPVFNNEETIERVIEVLLNVNKIDEIIVIDDASTDNSVQLISQFKNKIRLIQNPKNLGKGGAVVKGIKMAKGEVILHCDADLQNIQIYHISNLINYFETEECDMVIAIRDNEVKSISNLFALLSGERIFKKENIIDCLDIIAKNGNGLEQIINFAHKNKKVKTIVSKNIGHIMKYQRPYGLDRKVWEYYCEALDLAKTELSLKKRQISAKKAVLYSLFNYRLKYKSLLAKRKYIYEIFKTFR